MSDKEIPAPQRIEDDEPTGSINLGGLFPDELAESGSFSIDSGKAPAFGRLLDALPLPALVVDESRLIIYANEACRKIGWDCQAIRGTSLVDALDRASEGTATDALVEKAFIDRQPLSSDGPLEIGGERMWCRLHLRPLKQRSRRFLLVLLEDRTAERKQFLATKKRSRDLRKAHDELEEQVQQRAADLVRANAALRQEIAERNNAEQRLRLSEEKYKELVELLPEIVYEIDIKGVFTFINQTGLASLGYAAEDVRQGLKVLDLFVPEDRPRVSASLSNLLSGQKSGPNEYTALRKDGTTFPVVAHSTPITRGNRVLGVRGACLNISDRKRVEESLRQALERLKNHDLATSAELMKTTGLLSKEIFDRIRIEDALNQTERKYRTLVEAAQDIIWTVDLRLRYTYVSPAVTRVLGYAVDELMAMDPLQTLPPDQREQMAATLCQERTAASIEPVDAFPVRSVEIQQVHKDGSLRWFEVTLTSLRQQDGRPVGILGISRDVTHRKEAEEALQRAVAQAAQLREAAEAANRTKGEFLASMSHELRTPLNSIIGFSEVLEDRTYGDLNVRQLRYVNHVVNSGRHLLQLINDILDLAKIEAGKMELQPSPIRLGDLLEHSMVMIKEKAFKHKLRLSLRVDGALTDLPIQADELKLKQIMFNLLSNAAKFTPDGGAIAVDASHHGESVLVRVKDTGIGLSPQDCERIFGVFEQVDSSYSRKQQGTGLGLALTRRMVELHGGKVWAESEGAGKGSSFAFIIPLVAVHPGPTPPS